MGTDNTLYAILQVEPGADPDGIKKAFRTLAKRYHPDSGSGEGGLDFRILLDAYTVLSDPEARRQYDSYLATLQASRRHAGLPEQRGTVTGDRTVEKLGEQLNFILWEIEDLLGGYGTPDRRPDTGLHPFLLPILRFLDEQVLVPGGFPDYFFEARRMRLPGDAGEIIDIPNRAGHRPYVGIQDYFYQIRKRMDRFCGVLKRPLLTAPGAVPGVTLLDALLEAQRLAYHYLGGIRLFLQGETDGIAPYCHANPAFRAVSGLLPDNRPAVPDIADPLREKK